MSTQTLPLQDVGVGARLGADIVDASGRVLLPCGVELSAASLSSLRRRGVETVTIEVGEVDAADRRAAHRAVVEQELRVRFRRAGDSEATRLLLRAALEHLLERGE